MKISSDSTVQLASGVLASSEVGLLEEIPHAGRAVAGFESLFSAPEEHEGIVLPPEDIDLTETRADRAQKDLRAMEDRLLSSGMDIIEGVMRAPELMASEPPAHWVTEYGYERACRMHASAQAGLSNSKEAPVYIATAKDMVKGIIKSRSTQMAAPTALNVAIINQTNHYEYREVEVEDD